MQHVAKEGHLVTSIFSTSTERDYSNTDWNRRWFKLHKNAILFCYESYSGNLLMKIDLKSLNVSHDEIKWPHCIDNRPFVLSLRVRERDQTILLEADCKECMDSWAKLLTQYLPTEYTDIDHGPTYEVMKSNVGEKEYENLSASQHSDFEEYSYVSTDFSKNFLSRDDEEFPSKAVDPLSKSKTLDRNVKGVENFYQLPGHSNTHCSQRSISENKSRTLPKLPTKPKPKIKPDTKRLAMKRFASDKVENRPSTIHSYYEVKPTSSVDSNEGENYYETPDSFLFSGSSFTTESRRGGSRNTSTESILCEKPEHSSDPKTLTTFSSSSEDLAFLASIPDFRELLDNCWLMCFILPNGKVFTQLVDVTLPIESSLKELLHCFSCSHSDLNTNIKLKVLGDLHQTYTAPRTNTKWVFSLNWEFTFRSQGVMESKIVQIILNDSTAVKLDSELLDNFLYRIHHLPANELFSLSWVSFVKGNFPELNLSVSARHSACIYLIYSRMEGVGKLDVKKFIPSLLKKLPLHLKAVSQYIENYTLYKASSLCEVFLNEVNASQTGNAVSLTAKKVLILKRKIKYEPCLLTICRQHIGIVRSDVASQYDKADTFSSVYHHQDIQSWLLNEPLEVVAIKLTENKDDDWTKFKIVKTDVMQTVDLLFRDFFQVAKYYSKSVD